MLAWRSSVFMLLGLIGSMASSIAVSYAEEPGAIVDGAGFTLYNTESIKGFDAAKVERDPICDRHGGFNRRIAHECENHGRI